LKIGRNREEEKKIIDNIFSRKRTFLKRIGIIVQCEKKKFERERI